MHSTSSPELPELKAGILIGGQSNRMGQPKQLLELDGRPLLDYAVQSLCLFKEIALIGPGPVPEQHSALRPIADAEGFRGPLAGIGGALQSQPLCSWLIVACDQPWLSEGAIEWLLRQRRPGAIAVIPHSASRPQPFPGIYEACFLEVLTNESSARTRLADQGLGISSFSELPTVHSPTLPDSVVGAWGSVNTPDDLRDASVAKTQFSFT